MHQHERCVISCGAVSPRYHAVKNALLHLFGRKRRGFAHDLLYALNAEHFSLGIANVRYPVAVQDNTVVDFPAPLISERGWFGPAPPNGDPPQFPAAFRGIRIASVVTETSAPVWSTQKSFLNPPNFDAGWHKKPRLA